MIRITEPAPPAALRRREPGATHALCAAFDAARDEYLRGNRTFTFDSTATGIPYRRSAAAGPIPESMSRCGDWTAPAQTITPTS